MIDRIRQGLVAVENVHQKDAPILVKRARDPDGQGNADCQIEQVSSYFDRHNWSPWKLNTFNSRRIHLAESTVKHFLNMFRRVAWKLRIKGLLAALFSARHQGWHAGRTGQRPLGW